MSKNINTKVAHDRRRDQLLDLAGRRFGRLLVLSYVGRGDRRIHYWECKCDCGDLTIANSKCLLGGNTISCGCYRIEQQLKKTQIHGHATRSRTPEYMAWQNMIGRCEYQNYIGYSQYGGRGITVCPRWRHGEDGRSGFGCFLLDMGSRPSDRHSLDRMDVNGNYEPTNCRWATQAEQDSNRRNNVWIVVSGERMLLSHAMVRFGVKRTSFYRMLSAGVPLRDAFVKTAMRPVGEIA